MALGEHKYRRVVESLRIILAIIAGLLMLDERTEVRPLLFLAVVAFSIYAIVLLWRAANGSFYVQRRIFYWLDACWFLLLLFLAGKQGVHYFLFLLFPVLFAAWRTDYWESVAIAAFCGVGSLTIFFVNNPFTPWTQLLVFPLSLFVITQVFVVLIRIEGATQRRQELSYFLLGGTDPRHGFEAIAAEFIAKIAQKMETSVALLALQTFSGRCRVLGWEEGNEVFELSQGTAELVAKQALSLPADVVVGWEGGHHRWRSGRQIEMESSGSPSNQYRVSRDALLELTRLAGKERLMSVAISAGSVGKMRLILAGEMVSVSMQSLGLLLHIVEQVGPSIENACLRQELANQAAEAERARIGRDLHDSAIQPYVGLKFAVEAVQHRAGPDNPVATDLARLTELVTDELATMREVVSGLRGAPGKGGAVLSSAVRRQAARYGQLFGIDVEVHIEDDVPVSRRIAGEIFHMVAEGLSNIGRHTDSHWACVSLSKQGNMLVLCVENENSAQAVVDFTPRSLFERAAELGGSARVQCDEKRTAVTVNLPISDSKQDGKRISDECNN